MKLDASIGLRRGALRIDAHLLAGAGETVALVGPNGAGKTSCLHALAGLVRLEHGNVRLGMRLFDDGSAANFIPPEERRLGVVFQDHRLFPAMSVLDNVAYGPRSRGIDKRIARATAQEWLERVGITKRDEKPVALSGGEAARVALARALAYEPDMLLLDEPLAAVDASARVTLESVLRSHLANFEGPRLLVAHDIGDAIALADRLIVLEAGCVIQSGTADELARRPLSNYVADLAGVNRFVGHCQGSIVTIGNAELTVVSPIDGDVVVTLHPRAVSLFPERPTGSPRNVFELRVLHIESLHDRHRVQLTGSLPLVAEVTTASVEALRLHEGRTIFAAIKATELVVSPH
ncbi:MAG: ABC transporter ATP-binding protein [Planctomycetes bacterium]|nr:ABC transporter ATP-binding protein [Planctomycetota bacterium]MCB9919508.1 ABC transporter ATP-binding protein [Planctomycetota bacterium]